MICAVKPYEGQEPYIFFSYCHDDEAVVYPIIEQMGRDGYRVWYDDGIHPGADWPEVIARHIAGCAVCMAAITSRSAESHNCRNEITFAVSENKTFVPIIMEEFQMPLGIKLQIGAGQYIVKYKYSTSDFFAELYKAKGMETCWGRVSLYDIHRQEAEERKRLAEEERKRRAEEERKRLEEEELRRWEEEERKRRAEEERKRWEEEELRRREEEERKRWEEEELRRREEEELKRLEEEERKRQAEEEDRKRREEELKRRETPSPTPRRERLTKAVLVRASDGTSYSLNEKNSTLGRDRSCTVFLDDRYAELQHAEISQSSGAFSILAHRSVNGTALNGAELPEETKQPLSSPAMLDIAGERYLFLAGKDAERAEDSKVCAYLESEETGEQKALGADVLELGKNHPWANGTLSDNRVSREHGRIVPMKDGGYGYEAHKERRTNGTYYNRDEVEPGEHFLLNNGDRLGLGRSCNLIYHLIQLR